MAEPIDTRRMDNITILDLRVEKGVPLGRHGRLAGFVEVFNLLNANSEQNTSWSSDRPSCGRSALCRRASRGLV